MANGIYFRTQNRGQQLVVGSTLEEDERELVENPDEFNRFADDSFTHAKLHALHHRFPALPYRGAITGYCGLYTMNREDVHPIVGVTGPTGLIAANGFSGHGFCIGPIVGKLMSESIVDGEPSIPLHGLLLSRYTGSQPSGFSDTLTGV